MTKTANIQRTEIETIRHERSHGQAPRGRGGWLFEGQNGKIVFSFSGLYGDAKRAAIAHGTAAGLEVLFVCP